MKLELKILLHLADTQLMWLKQISLRYKFLAALTVIPLVGLSLFLLMAKDVFETDKIAYIFDTSLSDSKTRGSSVGGEISGIVSQIQSVVLAYRPDSKDITDTGKEYFSRSAKIDAIWIHSHATDKPYDRVYDLKKDGLDEISAELNLEVAKLVDGMNGAIVKIGRVSGESGSEKILLAARFATPKEKTATEQPELVVVALCDARELAQLFKSDTHNKSFIRMLLVKDGTPVFAKSSDLESNWKPDKIWQGVHKNDAPQGISELHSPSAQSYLVSYVEASVGDLVVVSMIKRADALAAIDVLIRKSVLFFLAVISLTAIIAVLASRGLTSSLTHLSEATRKVAEGDFEVRVSENSGGEIGTLAKSFNVMAGEIERLMIETAEKARMETELATARTVQETLFPNATATLGPVTISGRYIPASECGGDWWYYCENGDKVLIWIGDATGHGAPAALITSAARAIASVIETGPQLPVAVALRLLNRAIYDTSKGKMMMTFFLAAIDKRTGQMTFSNASHEAPLLLRYKDSNEYERDDFEPIDGINNPRLGERPDFEFQESHMQLNSGDRVVFYTDGVVDVRNAEKKTFGERRLIKLLASEACGGQNEESLVNGVVDSLESYRAGEPLPDDVTVVLCAYKGSA
jgi:sigma-B regulation protein RsbU (phosphoserine phosphatase)